VGILLVGALEALVLIAVERLLGDVALTWAIAVVAFGNVWYHADSLINQMPKAIGSPSRFMGTAAIVTVVTAALVTAALVWPGPPPVTDRRNDHHRAELRDLLTRGEVIEKAWSYKTEQNFRGRHRSIQATWDDVLSWVQRCRSVLDEIDPAVGDRFPTQSALEVLTAKKDDGAAARAFAEIHRANQLLRFAIDAARRRAEELGEG
jgi:hypothetical protein